MKRPHTLESEIKICPVTRKLGFSSKAEARKRLHRWRDRSRVKAVYLCRHCGHWHLTSQERRVAA